MGPKVTTPIVLAYSGGAASAADADLVAAGEWFSPLRRALDAFADTIQAEVTDRVRVRLFQGHHTVVDLTAEPPDP